MCVCVCAHALCLYRSFTSLCYSADGESILAGGHSKFVCIYSIREQVLLKKFEISRNLSLDAMEVPLSAPHCFSSGSPHPVAPNANGFVNVCVGVPGQA